MSAHGSSNRALATRMGATPYGWSHTDLPAPPPRRRNRLVVALCLASLALTGFAFSASAQEAPPTGARGGPLTLEQFQQRAAATAERRFRRLDKDGDGVVTADERRRTPAARRD